ncbi:DUF4157 domain-containing protein [Flavobacteriaceae bacterium]|nr:DUF4157 domain-containing protein [Flavobacteriaceae bacterium]
MAAQKGLVKKKEVKNSSQESPFQPQNDLAVQLMDNRPEAIQLQQIQESADNGILNDEIAQLQATADASSTSTAPFQFKENNTGLPDNLKSGMENLSGMSLDHVKVHRNSDKPAAVQAHAYAQGSDIHLASGQEKHLPHELGHVVQQAEGRVRPTTSVNGMAVNDSTTLEKEADSMGARALQRVSKNNSSALEIKDKIVNNSPVQRVEATPATKASKGAASKLAAMKRIREARKLARPAPAAATPAPTAPATKASKGAASKLAAMKRIREARKLARPAPAAATPAPTAPATKASKGAASKLAAMKRIREARKLARPAPTAATAAPATPVPATAAPATPAPTAATPVPATATPATPAPTAATPASKSGFHKNKEGYQGQKETDDNTLGNLDSDDTYLNGADEGILETTILETNEQFGAWDGVDGAIKDEAIKEKDSSGKILHGSAELTSDNLEWRDEGADIWDNKVQRSDAEQQKWLINNGHIKAKSDDKYEGIKDEKGKALNVKEAKEKDLNEKAKNKIAKLKGEEATKDAVTSSISTLIGFARVPSIIKKFKSDDNFDKFEAATSTAEMLANTTSTSAKIANAVDGGSNAAADNTAKISEFTGGLFKNLKEGMQIIKDLKGAYDKYKLINDQGGNTSDAKKEAALIVLNGTLSTAQAVMTKINEAQKAFGSLISGGVAASIPGIGIAMTFISMANRVLSLVQNRNLKTQSVAETSHKSYILSKVSEDKLPLAKSKMNDSDFHLQIKAAAEKRQLERDNPGLFDKFKEAQESGNQALKERLIKRFPSNYNKINSLKSNSLLKGEVGFNELYNDLGLAPCGITKEMLDEIIDDQTLINHLSEIKVKRQKEASIGLFTDILDLAADIAVLSGAGAAVGGGLKAGNAAFKGARKVGKAVKQGSRDSGEETFESGGGGKHFYNFGASSLDNMDLLKSSKSKEAHYFASSKLILDSIIKHDENRANIPSKPQTLSSRELMDPVKNANYEKDIKRYESSKELNQISYNAVENKINASGANVDTIKAYISANRSGNDIVKYLIDKLKTR